MIQMRCTVRDFMTSEPIEGCALRARLLVAPRFEEQIGGPGDPGSPNEKPAFAPLPDFTIAREFIRDVTTPGDGHAVFDFDVTSAFRAMEQMERNGVPAVDALAYAEFQAVCDTLDRRRGSPRELRENDTFETTIALDFAKTIVGHTTQTSTKLWFCLHGELRGDEACVCELDVADAADGPAPLRSVGVAPDRNQANTAVIIIDGLEPATHYQYVLRFQSAPQRGQPRTGRVLASGALRTFSDAEDVNRLAFAFGSCHLPVHHTLLKPGTQPPEAQAGALQMLERLGAITADRADMLLLTGDQVYADGIERNFPFNTWRERYEKRYHQVWEYPAFRRLVSSRSTLMMLDDHEIVDDFGSVPVDADRAREGKRAYRIFQHALNPGLPGGRLHYHFRRGAAAFFVLDTRTRRSPSSVGEFPILGEEQFTDLREWATAPETRSSDVIVLVTSVPFAWLPLEVIREAAEDFGHDLGTGLGFIIGQLFAMDSLTLGAAGYAIGDVVAGHEFNAHLNEPDFEDHWTFGPNPGELARVLTLLFDLANDLNPNTGQPRPSQRKRAVFVIGGDVHMGAVHLIRSNHAGADGRDHRANPVIYQLTSSPLSHPPEPDERYRRAIEHISDKIGVNIFEALGTLRLDLSRSAFFSKVFDADELLKHLPDEPATFVLDTEGSRMYAADGRGVVPDRNFGLFAMRRLSVPGRQYEFSFHIQGARFNIADRFVLDLDAPVIAPATAFTIAPELMSFGSVAVGDVATRTFKARNASSDPVTLSIAPPPPGSPFVWDTFEGTMEVGEERTFEVEFRPTSGAPLGRTLTVISSASGSPHRISLAGKGPGGIPQPPPEPPLRHELTFSTKALTFGSVKIGNESTRTLRIENHTGATVKVTIPAPPASSVFQWKAFKKDMPHATKRDILVTFRPKTNQIVKGTLRVTSTAFGSPHDIGLLGKGPGGIPVPGPDVNP